MCTRPGFGLFIAYFAVVVYSLGAITFIAFLANKNFIDNIVQDEVIKDPEVDIKALTTALRVTFTFFLVICLIVVVTSGVLARGIIKRRHRLMAPWIVLYSITIVCSLIYDFYILFKFKNSTGKFVSGIFSTIIQCLIFYPIYSLYRDVRIENQIIERTGRTV